MRQSGVCLKVNVGRQCSHAHRDDATVALWHLTFIMLTQLPTAEAVENEFGTVQNILRLYQ